MCTFELSHLEVVQVTLLLAAYDLFILEKNKKWKSVSCGQKTYEEIKTGKHEWSELFILCNMYCAHG